jgi:hypothetical protein
MGPVDAVTVQFRQHELPDGIIGHPCQQRSPCPKARQTSGDIGGGPAQMGHKLAGLGDFGTGWIGIKVHPGAAKDQKGAASPGQRCQSAVWCRALHRQCPPRRPPHIAVAALCQAV